MSDAATRIVEYLNSVQAERQARQADAALNKAVFAIKAYQSERFARSYADLLDYPRYKQATRFFLDDLYGPKEFVERDRQFARVVPSIVRLFPGGLVKTVVRLGELHALSEHLDTMMGMAILGRALNDANYKFAWRLACSPEGREKQIALMLHIGSDLDHFTRKPFLRQSLRLMRGPAAAAGLSDLQAFLEKGFDSFSHMQGASEFLHLVGARERNLAATLFAD